MKFICKNEFIYKGRRIYKGEVVEVSNFDIGKVKKLGVVGEPVKESKLERTVLKPNEGRKA